MISGKNNLVVGITTFDNEMLRISVPVLARLRKKFLLVVFNDNPATTITRRMISGLGYRGDLLVINSENNVGTMRARMEIIRAVGAMRTRPEWMVFGDDDDMIVNLDLPIAAPDNFAIIQNAIVIKHHLINVLRAMDGMDNIIIDDDNVVMQTPHINFIGTIFRTDTLIGMTDAIWPYMDKIDDIDNSLPYRAPVNNIMWSFVNMYARHINPNAVPIYMERVNYISIKIDANANKYGRTGVTTQNSRNQQTRTIAKYNAIMQDALSALAAPAGQN